MKIINRLTISDIGMEATGGPSIFNGGLVASGGLSIISGGAKVTGSASIFASGGVVYSVKYCRNRINIRVNDAHMISSISVVSNISCDYVLIVSDGV